MVKNEQFKNIRFTPEVIRKVLSRIDALGGGKNDCRLSVEIDDNVEWEHDSLEEFFADYKKSKGSASLIYNSSADNNINIGIRINYWRSGTYSKVSIYADDREIIEEISNIFHDHIETSRLPEPAIPSVDDSDIKNEDNKTILEVFIGHGRSNLWQELKNHLSDQHGIKVNAFETGARAGHSIRDILDELMYKNTFALLLHTAEDEQKDGKLRARQNVVHETGLFQGRLGFHRAIMVVEEGVEEFSNIYGVQQIRFSKGNIRETYGEILATIKREFPDRS